MAYAPPTQSAWMSLSRRVGPCSRSLGSAEDLLQTAFVRMLACRGPILNPDGFLLHVARNLAIDGERRDRTRPVAPLTAVDAESLRCDNPLPDVILDSRHRLAQVSAVLDRFPERTRRIFLMHRLDGCKYREIADRERISISAVEKHIAKATSGISQWRDA